MNRKFLTLMLSTAVTVLNVCPASADYQTDGNGELTVSGSVDVSGMSAYDKLFNYSDDISYAVLSEEDFENLDSLTDAEYFKKVLCIGQTNMNSSGDYSITFRIKGNTGNYKLVVFNSITGTETYDFSHVSTMYREFNDIVDSASESDMLTFIDEYKTALGVDVDALSLMDNTAKTSLAAQFIAAGAQSDNEAVIEFASGVDYISLLFAACDVDTAMEYIDRAMEIPTNRLNTPVMKYVTGKLTADVQKQMIGKYAGKALPTDFDDLLAYDLYAQIYAANTYYLENDEIILMEGNLFGFADSDITNYKNASDGDKKLILKTFSDKLAVAQSMADVRNALPYAIANPYVEQDGGADSSSGGSSKKRGSGSVSVPSVPSQSDDSQTQLAQSPFVDLDSAEWAKEAVSKLYKAGIVNGMTENTFAPSECVTREQFVKMLTKGLGLTGVEAEFSFSDVSEADWFYNAVGAAARAGITTGNADGSFGVGSHITREDMAVMMLRAAKSKGLTLNQTTEVTFSDSADISAYAKDAVATLANAGILNGSNGCFNPKASLTRAEAAKALYEFFNAVGMLR